MKSRYKNGIRFCLISHKSAPGPSGISYRVIKKLPVEFNEIIVALLNCCLSFSIILTQWKASHIISIPKPQKFEYDITNTRPIALLDTFRKVFTKIMTQRLGSLLKEHSVLKGLNFCGLKGEGTSTPLHIINGLLEDTKEQKKELWLATQDMSKAYDSVSLIGLQKALERIDLLTSFISLILTLFRDRSMKVLTEFSPSASLQAADGVDQGDSISPLLWRIFYDPLLTALQSDPDRGYHISVQWLNDVTDPSSWTEYSN